MKRFLINAALLVLLAGSFSSCKKKIEEDYLNPELTTKGSLSKLFNGMFLNKRIHASYWDYYTFIMSYTANYSQMVATAPSAQMYVLNNAYTDNRWIDFYNGSLGTDYNYNGPGILSNYREMQTAYGKLSTSDQAAQLPILKAATVLMYDQAAQMVDLYGDIPFSQANSLNVDGTVKYAAFDDAATLYNNIISDLKDLNTYFDTATATSSEFVAADNMYKGDLSKWQRYANSLRLRMLMRISNVSESAAQAEVTTMLGNEGTYPLISSNDQNALMKESPSAVRSDLNDVFSGFPYAPSYLLDTIMLANNDPRTNVYWDADTNGVFHGFPYDGNTAAYEAGNYATYDSATFFYNYNIPGVLFTAAEVSFLKAEAYERWGLGTAQTPYELGINQSIEFYYDLNQKAILKKGTWPSLTTPSAAVIATYLLQPGVVYAGTTAQKLAKIYTQKWENFFVLQAGQAWAEYRRTGYPQLHFATATQSGATTPPVRMLYPSAEALYNAENYSKVQSKDTRDTKIFWDVN